MKAVAFALVAAATGLGSSAFVASANPFCYETGPGYEKCISSPSGDYFHPIYQGPKVDHSYIPWVPNTSPPLANIPAAPPPNVNNDPGPPAARVCPQGSYVDPSDFKSCIAGTPGNDYVSLATPSNNPTAATFGTATSQPEADQIAVAQCTAGSNSVCQVAAQAHHACAAFAVRANGAIVSGVGPDLDAANASASSQASGGRLVGGRCSDPPGN